VIRNLLAVHVIFLNKHGLRIRQGTKIVEAEGANYTKPRRNLVMVAMFCDVDNLCQES